MPIPAIGGFGHVELSVTDGERSAKWWQEVLGFALVQVTDRPGYRLWNLYHESGVPVGLMVHTETASDTFDEHVVGLDHLALKVPDREVLHAWAKHFDELGISHSGVKKQAGGPLITFRDPDNIQLELWVYDPSTL